jgi:periplasmic protein TonB
MSEHLFEDPRAARTPSRQSSLVLASILLHIAALIALLVIEIVMPGVLPVPRSDALAWSQPPIVRIADIPLPPEPSATRRAPSPPADLTAHAAPVVAPSSVGPEPDTVPGVVALPGTVDGPGVAGLGAIEVHPAPPPAPPPPAAPVRLHSGIDAPVKTHDVLPQYPAVARAAGVKGLVIIEATIDEQGDVVRTRVLRSVPLLDAAALEAVRQWKYTPARLNGAPVSVLITVTVNFTLGQ